MDKESMKEYLRECKEMGFIVNEEHGIVKDPMEVFRNASPENPIFVDLTIKDVDYNPNNETYKQSFDAWRGIVACEGTRIKVDPNADKLDVLFGTDRTEQALFRGLENGKNLRNSEYPAFKLNDELRILDREYFFVNDIVSATQELKEKHKAIKDRISCKIHACVYPEYETPSFSQTIHMSPDEKKNVYNKMIDTALKSTLNPLTSNTYEVKGIETFEEAQKWMYKNHPESAIGFSFITPAEQVHLSFVAATSEKNWLGTREQREDYVREQAKSLGVEVGKFNYTEVDKVLAEREKVQKDGPMWHPNNKSNSLKQWTPKQNQSKHKESSLDR